MLVPVRPSDPPHARQRGAPVRRAVSIGAPAVAAVGIGVLAMWLTRIPEAGAPLCGETVAPDGGGDRDAAESPRALAPLPVAAIAAAAQPRATGPAAPAESREHPKARPEPEPERRYTVRVIAFHGNEGGRARAEGIQGYLEARGWSCVVRQPGWHWVVEVGEFRDYRAAESALSELRALTPPRASFGDAFILRRPIARGR